MYPRTAAAEPPAVENPKGEHLRPGSQATGGLPQTRSEFCLPGAQEHHGSQPISMCHEAASVSVLHVDHQEHAWALPSQLRVGGRWVWADKMFILGAYGAAVLM
jgi:hypothetical protein